MNELKIVGNLFFIMAIAVFIFILVMLLLPNKNKSNNSDFQYKQGHTIFHHDTMVVNGQNVLVPNMTNMRGGYRYGYRY